MEWHCIADMQQAVDSIVSAGYRHCYASCCGELQAKQQQELDQLYQRVEQYRQEAIAASDEPAANSAFVAQVIIEGCVHHLQLWLLFKSDRMDAAWNELIDAQHAIACALRFLTNSMLSRWYMELLALERLLFPPQQFVSDSHYWDYALCGICSGVYGDCDHVAGRLYMGQMCVKRPHEIVAINHVAFVEHPRDKGARVTKRERDGHMQCTLTYRQLEQAGDDQGDAECCILRAR